jgi:hypothetical protein
VGVEPLPVDDPIGVGIDLLTLAVLLALLKWVRGARNGD